MPFSSSDLTLDIFRKTMSFQIFGIPEQFFQTQEHINNIELVLTMQSVMYFDSLTYTTFLI